MCTALTFKSNKFYFGRTLDHYESYGEETVISPRNFDFGFGDASSQHFAIIGTAYVSNGIPLYYDAANEKGLCMAGLNFPKSANYFSSGCGLCEVSPHELIPWILSDCENVSDAVKKLDDSVIIDKSFENLPIATLHWIIADKNGCIVVEQTEDGLKLHQNPYGVMTNEPPFEYQAHFLSRFMNLSVGDGIDRFGGELKLSPDSLGMGAIGLPGDYSSQSRFVRAAFLRANAEKFDSESQNTAQFFHILDSVKMVRGCCNGANGAEYTIYSSCINAHDGIYYYKTYFDADVRKVQLTEENICGNELFRFPHEKTES